MLSSKFKTNYLDDNTPGFKYQSLQEGEVRLISFLPGESLQLKLHHFKLDDSPPYYCLSYAWGCPDRHHRVRVKGGALAATQSLWTALHAIGRTIRDKNVYLWADAVCINQADLQERGSQIAMMWSIYSQAAVVVIWLGEHSEDSALALKRVQELNKHFLELETSYDGDIEYVISLISPEDPVFFGQEQDCREAWQAIWNLYNRSWFTRAWIVQEYVAGKEYMFCCGDQTLGEHDLLVTDLIANVLQGNPAVGTWFPTLSKYKRLRRIKRRLREKCSLLELCDDLRPYQSLDPRDKVYAIASMAWDFRDGELPLDYTRAFQDIYLDVARLFLARSPPGEKLDFLGHVNRRPGRDSDGVSSWVPDWRTSTVFHPFQKHRFRLRDDSNSEPAGHVYGASRSTSFEGGISGRELRIAGFTVDTIARTLPATADTEDTPESLAKYDMTVKSWSPQTPDARYSSFENLEEAFLRTITGDAIDSDRDVTPRRPHSFDWAATTFIQKEVSDLDGLYRSRNMAKCMRRATHSRRLFYSEKGRMGLAPAATIVGDKVCILFGGQVLYVLRENKSGRHEFVGECYVHGLMDGEGLDDNDYKDKTETFVLV